MFRSALFMTMVLATFVAQAQEEFLSPQEIQDAWVGKTVVVKTAGNDLLQLKLNVDMTATVEGVRISDQGIWRLWEKGYCAKWQKIRKGEERCFTVRRQPQEIVNPDGTVNAKITELR